MRTKRTPAFHENGYRRNVSSCAFHPAKTTVHHTPDRYRLFASSTVFHLVRRCSNGWRVWARERVGAAGRRARCAVDINRVHCREGALERALKTLRIGAADCDIFAGLAGGDGGAKIRSDDGELGSRVSARESGQRSKLPVKSPDEPLWD